VKEIPAFRLIREPLTDEAASLPPFTWADPEIGNRHRLGGQPERGQLVDAPTCPSCQEQMTFYGQLDSINDDYSIADSGLIYVYLCFDCFEAAAVVDSD
jgi:hypothetical protein